MKKILIILIFCSYHGFSQKTEKSTLGSKIVAFKNIEIPPVSPECSLETTAELKKKCVNTKLKKLVKDNFNFSLLDCLEKEYIVNKETGKKEEMCSSKLSPGRKSFNIKFIVNKTGDILKINSTASHPKLHKEAIRIAKMIPKMTPGKHQDELTSVSFSLPFSYLVQ